MLTLISPAKTLDYDSPVPIKEHSQPDLLEDASYLNNKLKKLSSRQLSKLMDISSDLAELNYKRNQEFYLPFDSNNARQAIFAFKGDVYTGLDAYSLEPSDISYAQDHLRILSGLYGLLRPMDLMQAYRLEMGTKFKVTPKKSNLYSYWGERLAHEINTLESAVVVNLASAEYFKAAKSKSLNAKIITPQFLDAKGGDYKMISFFAKKARGLMTRYIIQHRIEDPELLEGFNLEGYHFNKSMSMVDQPVFTRDENW